MYKIRIDPTNALGRDLTDFEKRRLPFATSLAVNRIAELVWQTNRTAAQNVFDRPRKQTINAIKYRRSDYRKEPIEARVFVQDFVPKGTAPEKYLQHQAAGGPRADKPSELGLMSAGILPQGMQTVPGKGVRLNQYGNIPGTLMQQVLSRVRGLRESGYQGNETDTSRAKRKRKGGSREFFVQNGRTPQGKRRARLAAGIYERVKGGVKSILRFVAKPQYRPRYDIFGISSKVFNRRYPDIFKAALEEAMKPKKSR